MKRVICIGVLLLAALSSGRAMAADMPVKVPTVVVPQWGWTEFYFGVNIGYAQGKTSWCTDAEFVNCGTAAPTDIYSATSDGLVEGGQFGYRWQIPNTFVVVGFEAMLDGLTISSSKNGVPSPATLTRYTSFNNLGSATGQFGFAMDRLLAYGKGGIAMTELNLDAQNIATGVDLSTTGWKWVEGWTAGVGLEYMLYTHLSIGVEYDYYQFDVGNINGLTNTAGVVIGCAFCNFGRTSVQTIVGRLDVKLWPWGP
jgi:outer membrane immunogenic protein